MAEDNSAMMRLLAQYLSGAGADISAGNPIGANVNKMTQQNIQSQSFMKLLQKMLGGEVPEDGKLTMDSKGMKLDLPKSAYGKFTNLGGTPEFDPQGGDFANISGNVSKIPDPEGLTNPFVTSQSDISGADLAGLTPQDISQALQFKFNRDDVGQRSRKDLIDIIFRAKELGVDLPYKKALTEESAARTAAAGAPDPLDKEFIGGMTVRQWKTLTSDQKEYSLYAHKAELEGKTPMSEHEFKLLDPTAKEKFLRSLQKDPKLKDLAVEMAEASGIDIFGSLAVAEGKGELKTEQYFSGGKWAEDVDEYLTSVGAKRQFANIDDEKTRNRKRVDLKIDRIEQMITSRGAKIISERSEGNVRFWTIKFANGKTQEISNDLSK